MQRVFVNYIARPQVELHAAMSLCRCSCRYRCHCISRRCCCFWLFIVGCYRLAEAGVDAVGLSKASWAAGRGNRQPDFVSNLALFVSNAARAHVFTYEIVYILDGAVSSPAPRANKKAASQI